MLTFTSIRLKHQLLHQSDSNKFLLPFIKNRKLLVSFSALICF